MVGRLDALRYVLRFLYRRLGLCEQFRLNSLAPNFRNEMISLRLVEEGSKFASNAEPA